MNQLILTALINSVVALLARLDFAAALQAIYARARRELPQPLLDRIDYLVRYADRLDIPGEDKLREVIAALKAADSPARDYMAAAPGHLVRWAIETAVARMRAQA